MIFSSKWQFTLKSEKFLNFSEFSLILEHENSEIQHSSCRYITEHQIIFILIVITIQLTCPGTSIGNQEIMFNGLGVSMSHTAWLLVTLWWDFFVVNSASIVRSLLQRKNLGDISFQGQLWYPHQRLHHIKTPSNTPKYKNDIYTRLFLVSNINGPVSLSRIDFRTFFANDLRIFQLDSHSEQCFIRFRGSKVNQVDV